MEDELLEADDIIREIESISVLNHNSRSGLSFQRSQKIKAGSTSDELLQICHLVESHVPSLREKTAMRYERLLIKEECDVETTQQLNLLKDIIATKCSSTVQNKIEDMLKQVAEMPKEWTIIQLTSQYNSLEAHNIDAKRYQTGGLHISVFNCGQNEVKPFLITVDPPEMNGNKIELVQELIDTIAENKERLLNVGGKKIFKNLREKVDYGVKRERTEQTLKGIVKKIEENWLREWRCLLIGKFQNKTIEKYIKNEVDIGIKNQLGNIILPQKNKELLYQLTKGIEFLRSGEVFQAVQYCVDCIKDQSKIKEFCRYIKEINVKISMKYERILRHPVILVVDETLDTFPWEMMEVVKGEPVSRVPSLHFSYFLFKVHEKEIEEGHKVIRNYKKGTYIVNPDRDLENMEARMMSFYNYWVPDWKGIHDRKPTNDEFYDLLTSTDVFSYNGHGSGAHIMTLEMLQRIQVKAVVLLFGCGSTRITQLGPQVETYGSYHMYLISRCPCVLGMLWEVTDIDTDILTTELISNWIPSDASISWSNVDKSQWKRAVKTDKFVAAHKAEGGNFNNLELLRALWHSKNCTGYFLTKAACVVRGLPVKIKLN